MAYTPTPLIIGPMIRKMRAKNAEKNQPLASDSEMAREAPGLKIGTGVWKWPPVWPYAPDFFLRPQEEEAEAMPNNPTMAMMGSMSMGGMTDPKDMLAKVEDAQLDVVRFWSQDKSGVKTVVDEEAIESLQNHYSYYLRDGMTVLELGAAENSYLPQQLKLARHVGVGLNKELMETNPSLTDTLVVNLDVVEEEVGVKSDELNSAFGENSFDAILVANTVEFLTQPREVFKTCWRLLKPGGTMFVSFVEREALKEDFGDAQTKMWRNYNDDQHLWMAGSFFQFSVGEGWDGLKGFDISPESAKKNKPDANVVTKLFDQGKSNNIYMCQASKATEAQTVDASDPQKSFESLMWMTPTMEIRDKMLITPRLARIYQHFEGQEERQQKLQEGLEYMPRVYESLIKMDQFAFPFNLQARLAADLITDPDFNANDDQINALKMGLGLKKPSEDFWAPVGKLTGAMEAEDKVNLLAHIVPRFGSGDPAQEAALQTFVSGLKPTIKVVKSTSANISDADAAIAASELLACETLRPGRSSREDFAMWVSALTEEELAEYVARRKAVRENSMEELKAFQDERDAAAAKEEEDKKRLMEQVETARKERTMVFNEETGKMEEIEK